MTVVNDESSIISKRSFKLIDDAGVILLRVILVSVVLPSVILLNVILL